MLLLITKVYCKVEFGGKLNADFENYNFVEQGKDTKSNSQLVKVTYKFNYILFKKI